MTGVITLYPGRIGVRRAREEETVWPGSTAELARYSLYTVQIDPGFTLGELFQLLDREDSGFLAEILDEDIEPLLEEARLGSVTDTNVRIDYLSVSNVHQDGHLWREFNGWGPWDEPYDGAWKADPAMPRWGPIAVGLTPLCELLGLSIRYDPDLVFRDDSGEEAYRTRIDITVIEFLKAVFYELSFYGSPEERNRLRDDLQRRLAEIEADDVELIPADEVLREARQRLQDRS